MAYDAQQSGDIRATLALSQSEASNGTSRILNLPDGRQVVVPVPAGIRDGQEVRLEGQGNSQPLWRQRRTVPHHRHRSGGKAMARNHFPMPVPTSPPR